MIVAAQLMSHRVVQAQESVSKRHTGDTRGIVHLFTGNRIGSTVLIGSGQILKHHADCLQGKAVGVVAGHYGNIGFQSVSQNVQTGIRGSGFRQRHYKLRINDGNAGSQSVIGQRILNIAVLFIGNDREGGNLRTRAGGGGDTYHLSLGA